MKVSKEEYLTRPWLYRICWGEGCPDYCKDCPLLKPFDKEV